MYIFSTLLIIAVLLLLGNLARLAWCTNKNFHMTECKKQRFQGIMLFVMYCLITGWFIYCAAGSLWNIYCGIVPG